MLKKLGWGAAALAVAFLGLSLAQAQTTDYGTIVITVPADASVTIGGVKTMQRGPVRTYYTPPLPAGYKYQYEFTVQWSDGKKDHTVSKWVDAAPGVTTKFDFTAGMKTDDKKDDKKKVDDKKKDDDKKVDDKKKDDTKKDDKKKTDDKKKVDDKKVDDKKKTDDKNPAAIPAPRMSKGEPDAGWLKRHEGFVAIAKKGDVEVLLLGDSITDAWRGGGAKAAWNKHFAMRKAANFGIGGDRTEHVLWRIQNGELDGIKPKVVMLMIGTNNSGSNSAPQIAAGITEIVKTLRERTPAKILLLGVFPRGEKGGTPIRAKIAEINKTIAKLDDHKRVFYLDIGNAFLDKEGNLTKDIMPDFLHLSEAGYNIWGREVEPSIQALLGETK